MIIVTGGAGFIGSNLVAALNARGERDILVVDNLSDGRKVHNLADLDIADYMDCDDFLQRLQAGQSFGKVRAVLHQGACSSTTQWDGRLLMRKNFEYSKVLHHWCAINAAQFIYASSAAVYGRAARGFKEHRGCELPINAYGYSKFLFDQYVRRLGSVSPTQVVGLRWFNVYGPREGHKGVMVSTALHFNNQVACDGIAKLFGSWAGVPAGEQRRDFVHVGDCVDVALWFLDRPALSGIFNVGTGRAQTFNEVAQTVIAWHGRGAIRYIDFPEGLRDSYQNYTQADLTALRAAGYVAEFRDVATGIHGYLDAINARASRLSN